MSQRIETIQVQRTIHCCDVPGCDQAGTEVRTCMMCGKDWCPLRHGALHAQHDDARALWEPFCHACWDVGAPYRAEIAKLRDACEAAIQVYQAAWEAACAPAVSVGE